MSIKGIKYVLEQHLNNLYRIFTITRYERIAENRESDLGGLWGILSPMIQIVTYWIVFGLGMRGGKPVADIPYIQWMLGGLVPWFFLSACIRKSTNAILSKISVLEKMNFPTSILITTSVASELITHLITFVIVYAVFLLQGYTPNLHNLELIYYLFCSTFFCISFGLVFSVLTMIKRDVKNLVSSCMRMLFYITPVLWTTEKLPVILQNLLKLNPLYYIVEGYRASLFPSLPGIQPETAILFWITTLCMFSTGCTLIYKYRAKFIDLA